MNNQSNLKVYYGWSVMNKIRRKQSLSVIFENAEDWSGRSLVSVSRLQNTCFVRLQTEQEALDGSQQNRTLTEFSLFLNEKPFYGDLESVLETNRQADINNVPEEILIQIKLALRKGFKSSYLSIAKSHGTEN